MTTMKTVLVTGAGGPLGVNFCRSLKFDEEVNSVKLIGTDANKWHLPLSLCDETYLIPLAKESEAYLKALKAIIHNEKVDVLIPTHPVEVRAVAEHKKRGNLENVATLLPDLDVLDKTDSKEETQIALKKSQIPVPETIALKDLKDIKAAFERFAQFGPVWVLSLIHI